MTDPWPAIRKEVEALEHAAVLDNSLRYEGGTDEELKRAEAKWDAARAALNAKVERLMLAMDDSFGSSYAVRALLNEADDD